MTPSLSFLNFSYMNLVLKLGGKFFFLQIVYMLIVNTNEYLIILFSQADDVVNYQIYHKLFTLIGTVFTLALTPIWSAVTKALTEKNYLWIKSLYKKMYIIAFIGSACEYLLIIFLQFGINIWLKDAAITVNYGYALCFATLGTLMIYTGVFSSIANGISKVEIQLITYSIGFVIKIPIAYICTRLLDSWIGVVIGCLVSMTIYIIVQPIYIKKYMNSWGD